MDDNIRSFVELNEVSPHKAYITDKKSVMCGSTK